MKFTFRISVRTVISNSSLLSNLYVLDLEHNLKDNKTISTVREPEIEGCTIQPESGLAGETLFTISCDYLKDAYNMDIVFEYYQKNKNDKSSIGNILLKNKIFMD